jgi:hypothetical protein
VGASVSDAEVGSVSGAVVGSVSGALVGSWVAGAGPQPAARTMLAITSTVSSKYLIFMFLLRDLFQAICHLLAKYKLTIRSAHLLSENDLKFVIVCFIDANGDKSCPTLQFSADSSSAHQ